MKKVLLLVLVGLGVFLYLNRVEIARSVQRVDANSPQAMQASIEDINKGLSEEEKVVFAKGMMKLTAEGMDLSTLLALGGDDEVRWTALSKNLNGKSVREILKKGRN